ncbi:hypothetical protein AX17_003564 [Amanita inopinata Kibby_2008]|nr:hypothetical protein AX17_003564 [Amanita inopinata Kibby_2008]
MAMNRPVTSKPRGICRYFQTARGCFNGDNCKFLHGIPSLQPELSDGSVIPGPMLTPYDSAKRCKYFANGYCKRGADCWFRHVAEPEQQKSVNDPNVEEDELLCSICLEKPVTFGLLGGCSHVFCIQCIRQWRDPSNKLGDLANSENTKKCPMCRAPSKFITSSSRFWKEGEEGKARVIQAYKDSMSKVPCRYFQQSLRRNANKPFCPFGKDCFYQHLNSDGTNYIFKDGVDVGMKLYASQENRGLHVVYDYDSHFFRAGGIQFLTFDLEHHDSTQPDVPQASTPPRYIHNASQQPRTRRRRRSHNPRHFDLNAATFRELGRTLELLAGAGSDGVANIDFAFMEQALEENISNSTRNSVTEQDHDGYGGTLSAGPPDRSVTPPPDSWALLSNSGPSSEPDEDGEHSISLAEHLQIMTEHFIASIQTTPREESSATPPLLGLFESFEVESDPDEQMGASDAVAIDDSANSTVASQSTLRGINKPMGEMDEDSPANDSHVSQVSTPLSSSTEPPFVTDGRGRVVWSTVANKTTTEDV